MSKVSTPGIPNSFRKRYSSLLGLTEPKIGIVLKITVRISGKNQWYWGSMADVLLTDSFHIIKDVMITASSSRSDGGMYIPLQETSEDIRDKLTRVRTSGGSIIIPSPKAPPSVSKGWGSWVIVNSLSNGMPYIQSVLVHPNTPLTRMPSTRKEKDAPDPGDDESSSSTNGVENPPEPNNTGGEYGSEDWLGPDIPALIWTPAMVDLLNAQIRKTINGSQVSMDDVKFEVDLRYESAFQQGYMEAKNGEPYKESFPFDYESGEAISGSENYEWMKLNREATDIGWRLGQKSAIASPDDNSLEPDVTTTGEDPKINDRYDGENYDPDNADLEDDDNIPAQTGTMKDGYIGTGGHRIVMKDGADMVIDSRAAGKIRIQGSSTGIRITASGAKIEVGDDGKSISILADNVTVAGRSGRAVLGDQMLAAFNSHTHPGEGKPPTALMNPSDVLSDKVAIG